MSGTKSTAQDVEKLIIKAREIFNGHIVDNLISFCHNLLHTTDFASKYHDVTGNTLTSYACGLYVDGSLLDIVGTIDYMKRPTRVTLKKGEWYDKNKYYSGADVDELGRPFLGTMGGNYYGYEASIRFLKSYNPSVKKGFAVCMCTGTEYSEYLEKEKGLNVLSETYQAASPILLNNLKKIK